jgi:hypothetical protein
VTDGCGAEFIFAGTRDHERRDRHSGRAGGADPR